MAFYSEGSTEATATRRFTLEGDLMSFPLLVHTPVVGDRRGQ